MDRSYSSTPRCSGASIVLATTPPGRVGRSSQTTSMNTLTQLFFLTCISLFTSFILLVVSMLDMGLLSLWINPCASLFAFIQHVNFISCPAQTPNRRPLLLLHLRSMRVHLRTLMAWCIRRDHNNPGLLEGKPQTKSFA
ncbi:hypothetical protein C8R43DRAFT_972603 [Mycena crocata]|nr:hypothetical protein C8R43DRAFT_972603 [Mycena crocata]